MRFGSTRMSGLLMASAFALLSPAARAGDAAAAEALFDAGLEALQDERYGEACPKIEESHRLEARPGTLFTLADCWRLAGKTATALARFEEYLRVFERMSAAEQAKQRGRERHAQKHVAELSAVVPRLIVRLSAKSSAGATVERNGIALGAPSLGVALPVDPGEHVLVVRAPDGSSASKTLRLAPGESRKVTLEIVARPKKRPRRRLPPRHRHASSPESSSQRTAGVVLLGVGAAGLLASAVTAVLVLDEKSTVDENCGIGGDAAACNAEGRAAAEDAQSLALASTIAFGIGVAGIGAGAAIYFSAPDPNAEHVGAGAGITLKGAF
jgi:hypothetical protein